MAELQAEAGFSVVEALTGNDWESTCTIYVAVECWTAFVRNSFIVKWRICAWDFKCSKCILFLEDIKAKICKIHTLNYLSHGVYHVECRGS